MSDNVGHLGLIVPDLGDTGPPPEGGANVPHWLGLLAADIGDKVAGGAQGVRASRPDPGTARRFYYATDVDNLYYDTGTAWVVIGVKPGTIVFTFAGVPGVGYLPCDGRAYRRDDYPDLRDAIGTSAGSGDGRTTFNVPDAQDVFLLGSSPRRLRGARGGTESVILTVGQMPAHEHRVIDPGHDHINTVGVTTGAFIQAGTGYTEGADGDRTQTSTTGITIGTTGRGEPVPTMPPWLAANCWIKV